ncbi:hypothetical protein [Klebsiella pneumoniae]|uniref:hypothetical protein n=1 Tax=Klebsiella pneumoniae TaxID=573 RepID=UPI000F0E6B28|nr:hypothetical protein [Klebsiella pneumoniae]VCX70892.1 hypothetical protein BANRA_01726 [Klebsiella pneumoniae]
MNLVRAVFKRFTLLVVGYIREIRLGQKETSSCFIDAEHDKRIAENYVFDEVQGIYVSRAEHERRARFNRMIINQHLMRSGVFQVVPLNPLSLMAILITYQH